MDAVAYLQDVARNRGFVEVPKGDERINRLLNFWRQFDDTDRPFATGLYVPLRTLEDRVVVKVPFMVLNARDIFSLARKNGAHGVLQVPKEYR